MCAHTRAGLGQARCAPFSRRLISQARPSMSAFLVILRALLSLFPLPSRAAFLSSSSPALGLLNHIERRAAHTPPRACRVRSFRVIVPATPLPLPSVSKPKHAGGGRGCVPRVRSTVAAPAPLCSHDLQEDFRKIEKKSKAARKWIKDRPSSFPLRRSGGRARAAGSTSGRHGESKEHAFAAAAGRSSLSFTFRLAGRPEARPRRQRAAQNLFLLYLSPSLPPAFHHCSHLALFQPPNKA